jgi:hypothetical protein
MSKGEDVFRKYIEKDSVIEHTVHQEKNSIAKKGL